MKIKAVFFDLDNTLIDFMKMKKYCVEASLNAMKDAGLNISKNRARKEIYKIYSKFGIEYQKVLQEFCRRVYGKLNYKIIGAGIAAYRKERVNHLKPYPEVLPTLKKLKKKGIKLALISDAPKMNAWTRIGAIKIYNYFDLILTFDDTKKRKDTGIPFKKALKILKLKREEVLVVGDWYERDIVGAKKAGIKSVLVKNGKIGKILTIV